MNSLEQRIRDLEDIESLRRLKAAYCDACDDDHNGKAIAALFTPDGTWQYIGRPALMGRDAIAKAMFAIRDAGTMRRSSHLVANPVIEIDGDSASGRWRFTMLSTSPDGKNFHRIIGRYHETYVRKDNRWWFQSLEVYVEERGAYEATPDQ